MLVDMAGAIGCIALIYMGLTSLRQARRLWRNEPTRIDNYRPTSPTGRMLWRANRRVLPIGLVIALPALIAALVLGLAGGASNTTGEVARGVLVVFSFLAVLVIMPIDLLNRPKVLVPPHLRDEPGLIHELTRRHASNHTLGDDD